jgi:hypothetical protein
MENKKMTHEDYAERGYYAADYIKLSQWQRFRGLVEHCKEEGIHISIYFDNAWFKLKLRGIWTTQNSIELYLPFILIIFHHK